MPRCGATFDENTVPLGQGGLQGSFGKGNQPTRRATLARDHRRFGEGFSRLHPLRWRGFSEETQREAELGHSAIIPGKANSTRQSEGCQNMPSNPDVTMLLQAWRGGDSQALERLVRSFGQRSTGWQDVTWGESARDMSCRRPPVNEAYMRLIDWKGVSWQTEPIFWSCC